ncbi:hypothetical protein T11_10384 [Trichinella zimbabwensis]|uniref:Uncharacterized protein n=1 Tax=Trichinella zimbabwensis TaxID=268475 RepID=A0A0V1HE75_9BILA|nr:hypothetical protein T11_10384 [Trichinella zimbabwensis]
MENLKLSLNTLSTNCANCSHQTANVKLKPNTDNRPDRLMAFLKPVTLIVRLLIEQMNTNVPLDQKRNTTVLILFEILRDCPMCRAGEYGGAVMGSRVGIDLFHSVRCSSGYVTNAGCCGDQFAKKGS